MSTFITVAIPYVNATPHLGYAFELVDADLAARARRFLGDDVRFLGGTDDHSSKNVVAARAAGESTRAFVDRHAAGFAALGDTLGISFDDFIRTSSDPRHRPAVERLWRACGESGDLYRRSYDGLYCAGCEQFYEPGELDEGRCPDRHAPAEPVTETNWFFRLSRYQQQILAAIESGTLLVEPESYRNEILAFVRGGLTDISVSRPAERSDGWGIPVPDDASQVIYVWFDALTNYISSLGYSTGGRDHDRGWRHADERIHVVGKGIVRFHAVYWPAILLSAGEPLPTRIHVHPYLTADGEKLSKSSGGAAEPATVVRRYGVDAVRWWLAAEVGTVGDTDFTEDRLVARADADLANGIGNATRRVLALVTRYRDGIVPCRDAPPLDGTDDLPTRVAVALATFDRRSATTAITDTIARLNRDIEATAPWQLARDPSACAVLDRLLGRHVATLARIAEASAPIVPELAGRVQAQLVDPSSVGDGAVIQPRLGGATPTRQTSGGPGRLGITPGRET